MKTYETSVESGVDDIKNKLINRYAVNGFGMIQNTGSTMAFQRMVRPSGFVLTTVLCIIFSFLIFPIAFLVSYAAWGSRPAYFIFFEKGPAGKTKVISNDENISDLVK